MPSQPIDQARAMLLIEMDQDFGIALGPEPVSPAFEPAAQLLVVVDLAVEDDLDRAVFVADRLVAPFQVDDRQPPMRQPDPWLGPEPLGVRAAMGDRIAHGLQQAGIDRSGAVGVDDACNTTHRSGDPDGFVSDGLSTRFGAEPRRDPRGRSIIPDLPTSRPHFHHGVGRPNQCR